MKRFAAVILVLSFIILPSCSASGSEDDLNKIESAEYGFVFYYDDGWTEDVAAGGVALKSPSDAAGVSKAQILVNVGDTEAASAEEYWSAYESSLIASFGDYALKKKYEGEEATKLGGIDAVRAEYTATVNGALCRFALVLCVKDGKIYNILLASDEASFNTYSPCMATVIEYFEFITANPDKSEAVSYTGGRAESQNGDYYFNYSTGWGLIRNDGMIAVKPEGGNATVSVTAFSLSDEKADYGVNDYWKEYETELKGEYPGYALTKEYSENEPKLGGVAASRKEYAITVDSVKYNYIQVICITEGYVYSVLFTSDESEYAEYSGEFDKILTSFTFR